MVGATPSGQRVAVGFLEAQGYVPIFDAIDAMIKVARVELGGTVKLGGALIAVSILGELDSVLEAMEVGEETVRSLYAVEVRSVVFANPCPAVRALARAPDVVVG